MTLVSFPQPLVTPPGPQPRSPPSPEPQPMSPPFPEPQLVGPQQQIRSEPSDRELGYGGHFIVVLNLTAARVQSAVQVQAAVQVPAAVHEDLDDDSEMWKMFLDEVKEEDSTSGYPNFTPNRANYAC